VTSDVAAAAAAGGVWFAGGPARTSWNRPVVLTDFPGEEQYPSLSPDGREVVFSWKKEGEADIFVIPVDRKAEPRRLTQHRDRQAFPRWSPDGRSIAYTHGDTEQYHLAVIPAAGGPPKPLGRFPFRCIEWTADSQWIIATHAGGSLHERLALVSPVSGEIRPIPYEELRPATRVRDVYPALSPDGKSVAFSRMGGADTNRDLFTVPLAGGQPRRLTHRNRYISGLCFTPGGGEVLFQSSFQDYTGLFRVPVSGDGGREPPPVAGVGGNSHYPVFAGPGWKGPPRLVYSTMAQRRSLVRLDFMPGGLGLGTPRTLVEPPEAAAAVLDPSVSPDGRLIAYARSLSGQTGIWIVSSDGGPARHLTSYGGDWLGPVAWSPDGRSLTFHAEPGGRGALYTIPVDGGPVTPVATAGGGSHVSYSPDGRCIYFFAATGGKRGHFRIPSSGGPYGPELWQCVTVVERVGSGVPSSDGRLFLFTTEDGRGIFAVPVEGGEERLLIPLQDPVWFAVVGEWIYYLPVKGESELTTLPKPLRRRHLQDGRDELVGLITVPVMFRNLRTPLAVDPGGHFVVFTEFKPGADLKLVDGFR
jgi:Tol biopolymer transport system component